jgi:hypothetical protein
MILVYDNCISWGTSFLLHQKDRVVFMVQEYWLIKGSSGKRLVELLPATFLPNLVKVQKEVGT